jgi:ubiquinone/menaquinone biosynthesis C-methylase UbiE
MDWEKAFKTDIHTYWDTGRPTPELVAVMAFKGLPEPGQTALDIGCGTGRETVFLAKLGYRAIGVDMTKTALEKARRRAEQAGVDVDFREGNVLEMPVADASVDFANDCGCFHVIPEQDREKYAAELYRVLKPGGVFLLRGIKKLDERMVAFVEQVTGEPSPFVPVDEEVIERYFSKEKFELGPVLPIMMGANDKTALPGSLVVLRKR